MSTLIGTLVVFHLIGWAIALGGLLSTMKEPKILPGVLHGLVVGLGLCRVQRITCHGQVYAAGNSPDALILTHNAYQKP